MGWKSKACIEPAEEEQEEKDSFGQVERKELLPQLWPE